MDKFLTAVGAIIMGVLLGAGISLLMTFPEMWAINYTFSPTALLAVFGVAKLAFWKTFVFTFLVSLFF